MSNRLKKKVEDYFRTDNKDMIQLCAINERLAFIIGIIFGIVLCLIVFCVLVFIDVI